MSGSDRAVRKIILRRMMGVGKWHATLKRVKREEAEKERFLMLLKCFPKSFDQRNKDGK